MTYRDFQEGDWVMRPGEPESLGRVFDIRDYGLEVWVKPPDGQPYYTFCDQLVYASLLERIALAANEPSGL